MSATIDLDALVSPSRLPTVTLYGRKHVVQRLSGSAAHRLAVVQEATDSGASMMAALIDVVADLLPGLTPDERDRLAVEQIAAVVQLSRGLIADVEASIAALDAEKNGA